MKNNRYGFGALAKGFNLDSVPEIEKAFNSMDGQYSFLEDLYQEKSLRQIKESLFVSPSAKENQFVKTDKKIQYTFSPGRYQVVIQNLLTTGSTTLDCSFKGGKRNESMELKPNKSWDFIIQILPDESVQKMDFVLKSKSIFNKIPYNLEVFKVMDLIDERRGNLCENEENIYKFDIIPGQYRIRLTSKDKTPFSIKINFGGQTESSQPTTYEIFDSKLFSIPTSYPQLFHGSVDVHVIIKNKTKKDSKYYLQILQIYGIDELSDIDERNARIIEEEIKKKANEGFIKLDSELLVSLMYYCQEQEFKSLHQYVKRKFNAIETYKKMKEMTENYVDKKENDFKQLKSFLTSISNFQFLNPQLKVSDFKDSIQKLFDGVLMDEQLQRELEDVLDNPTFDSLEKILTQFEEETKKFNNIPSVELKTLIDKSNEIFVKMKFIFEMKDKLKRYCDEKNIIEIENTLEKMYSSPYLELIEKDIIIAKNLLEELIKREETVLELNSLMKTTTKENAYILKKFLNDNHERLNDYNYKNGFDLYLSLSEVVVPNVEEKVEEKKESHKPRSLMSFSTLAEKAKKINEEMTAEEIKAEEDRIKKEEEKRKLKLQLEKEEEERKLKLKLEEEERKKQEEENQRKREAEERKTQEIIERRKERKRKKLEKEQRLKDEKERKEKERDEKIITMKQKLKEMTAKRLKAEDTRQQQEILLEKEKFKRLNPKFKLLMKSAQELPKMDIGGLSDPYAIINFANQSFKTEIKKKTLTPIWNEEFQFNARGYLDDSIQIELFDWNKLHSDEYMGSIEIPLSSLKFDVNTLQMKLEHLKNPKKSKGSITLEITTIGFGIGIGDLPPLVEIPDEYLEMELEDDILSLENQEFSIEKSDSSDDEEPIEKITSSSMKENVMEIPKKTNISKIDTETVIQVKSEVVLLKESFEVETKEDFQEMSSVEEKEVESNEIIESEKEIELFVKNKEEPKSTIDENIKPSTPIEFPTEMDMPEELSIEQQEELLKSPLIITPNNESMFPDENEEINTIRISLPQKPKPLDKKLQKLLDQKNLEKEKEKKINEKLIISSQELSHELLTILHRELLRSMYSNESLVITRKSPNSKGLVDAIFNVINYKKKPKYLLLERSFIEIFSNHQSPQIQEIVKYFYDRKMYQTTKYLDENMSFLQFVLDCNCLDRLLNFIINDRIYLEATYEPDSILSGNIYRDDLMCLLDLLKQIKFMLGYLPIITSNQLNQEKEKEIKNLKVLSKTILQYYLMKNGDIIGIDTKEKGTSLTNLIRTKYIHAIERICSHGLRFKRFDYKYHIWEIFEAFESNSKAIIFKEMVNHIRSLKLKSNSLKFKILICYCLNKKLLSDVIEAIFSDQKLLNFFYVKGTLWNDNEAKNLIFEQLSPMSNLKLEIDPNKL
eukprot:gene700-8952_t